MIGVRIQNEWPNEYHHSSMIHYYARNICQVCTSTKLFSAAISVNKNNTLHIMKSDEVLVVETHWKSISIFNENISISRLQHYLSLLVVLPVDIKNYIDNIYIYINSIKVKEKNTLSSVCKYQKCWKCYKYGLIILTNKKIKYSN